jgi:hypothetical protein
VTTNVTGQMPVTATAQDASAQEPARDTATAGQRAQARWRRWRWPLAVAGSVITVSLLLALFVPRTTRGSLDPDSAAASGSRAVAQILRRQGVDISRVTRSDEAAEQATAGTTLVVVRPSLLGPEQLRRLSTAGDLVLVQPDTLVLDELAGFAQVAGSVPDHDGDPDCSDPAAAAAGTARTGGELYRVNQAHGDAMGDIVTCYPQPEEPGLAGLIRARTATRTTTVLGQADVLRNQYLAEQGNAALALRLLGGHDRLVWYLPDPMELSSAKEPPSLLDLTPAWVRWATLQLAVALTVAMLWRGRRLGQLVTEPLPIVVRAAETQEGRARLYRQAGARDRAAATLRTASARRLAARLDVTPDADPRTIVRLAAETARQPVEQVHQVLLGPAPRDDAALVQLADQLDALEHEVIGARSNGYGNVREHRTDPAPHRTNQPDREAPHR